MSFCTVWLLGTKVSPGSTGNILAWSTLRETTYIGFLSTASVLKLKAPPPRNSSAPGKLRQSITLQTKLRLRWATLPLKPAMIFPVIKNRNAQLGYSNPTLNRELLVRAKATTKAMALRSFCWIGSAGKAQAGLSQHHQTGLGNCPLFPKSRVCCPEHLTRGTLTQTPHRPDSLPSTALLPNQATQGKLRKV